MKHPDQYMEEAFESGVYIQSLTPCKNILLKALQSPIKPNVNPLQNHCPKPGTDFG